MKKIKFLGIALVALMSIFTLKSSVSSMAHPSSLSGVRANNLISYDNLARLYYKTYSDGVVFCSSFHVPNVGSSCTLSQSQWSEPAQAGVAAVIERYNSSKSEKNYFYAELAINEFLYYYETGDSTNKVAADARNSSGVKPFYDAAVNAYNSAKKGYSITLTADGNKLSFAKEDDNYVSNLVSVNTNDYNVSISGIDGAKVITKENGFVISIPASKIGEGKTVNVDATVTSSKKISVAKYYNCGSGNQNLVPNITDFVTKTDSKKISGSITVEKRITKLKISKLDVTTKK